MNKSVLKHYFGPLILLGGVAAVALTFSWYEGSSARRRRVCLKELNEVLSCVRTPLDFDTFAPLLKKRVDKLATLMIHDVKEQGLCFEPDEYTEQLFHHIRRIHTLSGGRAWLEAGQRQALFRLHEAGLQEAKEKP